MNTTDNNPENAHIGNSYRREDVDDEISLKELILKLQEWWRYLMGKWKVILLAGIIGGLLGLGYSVIKKPIYTAETTFVLEEGESGGGLAQYAGLASMVGIDLGGGGGGIFKGDHILELYKSRRMIQKTLLAKDTFEGKQQQLIERYIEFNKMREGWEDKPELVNVHFTDNPKNFSRIQDSLINKFTKDINDNILEVTKPDKKLSIISVKVKSKDELFSKSFADNIVAKVNAFYVATKTKKSLENLTVLQNQADSVKAVLNASIGGVAAAVDANPNLNPAFQRLRVGSQRKQVDVQASGAVYQEIVKNLELAKISLRNDKPLIQVIDEPRLPLKKDSLGRIVGVFLGVFFTGLFSLFFFTSTYMYRKTMKY